MTCLETVVDRLLRETPGFFHGYMISQEDVWTLVPTGEKGRVVDEGKLFIRGGVTGNGKSQGKARTRNAAATRQHPIHKLLRCQSGNFFGRVDELLIFRELMMPHNALCHRKFEKSTIDLSVVEKSSENSSPTNESSEKRCLTHIMRGPKGGKREGGGAPPKSVIPI